MLIVANEKCNVQSLTLNTEYAMSNCVMKPKMHEIECQIFGRDRTSYTGYHFFPLFVLGLFAQIAAHCSERHEAPKAWILAHVC